MLFLVIKILKKDDLTKCKERIKINSENFFKYFEIHNSNFWIIKTVKDGIHRFKIANEHILELIHTYFENERIDFIFRVQTFTKE